MATVTKTQEHSTHSERSLSLGQRYDLFIERLKFSHFALVSMAILVGSCVGGIATMFVFENNSPIWQFLLAVGFSMANLVAAISQAPTKWVFNLLLASLLVSSVLIFINL